MDGKKKKTIINVMARQHFSVNTGSLRYFGVTGCTVNTEKCSTAEYIGLCAIKITEKQKG